jgi:hypothetical protein
MLKQNGDVEALLSYQHPRAERRASVRHHSSQGAVSRPLENAVPISWGAVVHSISASGIGLHLCYPFKPDTLLAVELPSKTGTRTLLVEVVHVAEHSCGSWVVGCAFVQRLTEPELADLLE